MTTSWLSSITILYDNTLEKGVLYDARTNSIVTVTTESAKLLRSEERRVGKECRL